MAEGSIDAAGGDPKVLVDRLDEIDLEDALKVREIDTTPYLPPAVLAVYGEKGMPVHIDADEASDGASPDVSDDAPSGMLFSEPEIDAFIANDSFVKRGDQGFQQANPTAPRRREEETGAGLPVPQPAHLGCRQGPS